jgi:sRNA-binding regulator protein Hfq
MTKIFLSILLCSLLLTADTSFIYAQNSTGQDDARIAKIKAKIIKRESREDTRATIKLTNGTRLKGSVSQATEDSFTLTDVKTGQKTSVLYSDVAQVSGGFPNSAKIGIIAGVATAGVIILAIVYKLYNN